MKKLAVTLAVLNLMTLPVFAQMGPPSPSRPATLKQSIIQAINENPETKSTDRLLEAIQLNAAAAKADLLPSAYVSCSLGFSKSNTSFEIGSSKSTSMSRSCGAGASYTLFDGGAGRNSARSAKASAQAAEYAFQTADSLIPNTKGGLAFETLHTFVDLSAQRDAKKFLSDILVTMQVFKKLDPNDANLSAALVDIESSIQQTIDKEQSSVQEYKFKTKADPADELETLDQTIESLAIPKDVNKALEIALENSSSILRRQSEVEMATYNLAALKGALGPRVTVNTNVSRGRYEDFRITDSGTTSTNAYIGLTATIPFNFGSGKRKAAARKSLEAKELELEHAKQEAEHTIRKKYLELESAKNSYLTIDKNFKDQAALVREYAKQVEAGNREGLDIAKILVALDTLGDRYDKRLGKQISIIMNLFSVQQATGLLFSEFAPIEQD